MKKFVIFLNLLIILISCQSENIQEETVKEKLTYPEANIWWNDSVFYEIFIRSFYDSNNDGIGDINGIIEKLDYLNDGDPNTKNDLGINGIWLMPISPSPSYHGYDITDYKEINSDYGTVNDFKNLINECHKRGIKVIIDFVGNHTSDQHPWFKSSSEASSKRDWYRWSSTKPNYTGPWGQEVWHKKNDAYYYGTFWSGMPDLNYKNIEVTNEIKNLIKYWYEDIGIDGFRIDAVKHWIEEGSNQENTNSTLNWWREMYAFQKNLNPSIMMVGEVWSSSSEILKYSNDRLDYCFEFDLSYAIMNAVKNNDFTTLKSKIIELEGLYPNSQYGSFLTNHDQNRSFEEIGYNINKSKLAASLLLTLPGIPYIYYGEEIAMLGKKPDEDIRRPMQWSDATYAGFSNSTPWRNINNNYSDFNVKKMKDDKNSLWSHYSKLIKLRTANKAISKGKLKILNSNSSNVFAYLKSDNNINMLIIHNFSSLNIKSFNINLSSADLSAGNYSFNEIFSNLKIENVEISSNTQLNYSEEDIVLTGHKTLIFDVIKN
tara:strand:+ start:1716 stop:3347 length:1632 start_codon:yes stop_codon:yes gene_type:complete